MIYWLSSLFVLSGCEVTPLETPLEKPLETIEPSILVALTPTPDKGMVIGRFFDYTRNTPLAKSVLYLGDVLQDTQGKSTLAGVDPSRAPRTYANQHGEFIFKDVPPKQYALATISPRGFAVFLVDPDKKQEIIITIKAGEILNLNKVYLDLTGFK